MGSTRRFCLWVCLALPLALLGQERSPLPDDEAARSAAILAWHGSFPTPTYLDFKGRVAQRETERWGGALPRPQALGRGPAQPAVPLASAWVNLGPYQGANAYAPEGAVDSGRPTAILPHPTNPRVLFLGTAGGGVWRCQNADPASSADWVWEPLTDALPAGTAMGNLSIGALASDVDQPGTLYLSLGDSEAGSADGTADGRGFYISGDGGGSWIRGGDLGPVMTRTKSIVSLHGGTVLVSGNGGLYRSTDRGRSFQQVPVPGFATQTSSLLALSNGTVLLTGRSTAAPFYGSVWFSLDGGLTWAPAAKDSLLASIPLSRITLGASPSQPDRVWGIAGNGVSLNRGLLRSDDGGRSWTYQPDPSLTLFGSGGDGAQGNYNQLLAVDPGNANRIFVGANLGLWRSLDGGASWTRIANWVPGTVPYGHADWHVAAWSIPGSSPVLYLGNDGGLAVLRDPFRGVIPAGEDLGFLDHRRGKGLSTHLIYHLGSTLATTPADARSQVTIGLQDNGVWSRVGSDLAHSSAWTGSTGGDGFGTLIHPRDGNLVLATSQGLNIYRSTDRTNFDDANVGITPSDPKPFLSRLALGYADPSGNTVYTASLSHLYRSLDFGATWAAYPTEGLSLSNLRYFNSALADPNAVAIIDNTTGYVTYSGGTSWTTFGEVPNSQGYYGYVWFSTERPQTLYLTSVAFSASSSHLWRSTNGGATWVAMDRTTSGGDNGFPFGIPVHIVQNDPLQTQVLYAGTDFGVYRSEDGGGTWTRFGSDLPLISIRDFYLAPDGSFLRAGSHGRGVWELVLQPILEAPRILRDPASLTVQAGESAAFGVTCVGVPLPAYQWYRDGAAIPGETRSTLVISSVVLKDSGASFTVQVANSQGGLRSQAAVLTVLAVKAPLILVQPASLVVDAGHPVTFSVGAGGVQLAYQWRRNGIDLPGAAGSTLSLASVALGDSGDRYSVRVTNPGGSILSREVHAVGVPPGNLLQNGGFEDGSNGWVLSSTKGNVSMLIGGPERAFLGGAAADLGRWRRGPDYDRLTQTIAVPEGFLSGTLRFWVMMGGSTKPYDSPVPDTFKARLLDGAGAPLSELFTIDHRFGGSPSQPSSWYHAELPFTLPAGSQTFRLQFESFEEGVTSFTGYQLDEVELVAKVQGGPSFTRQPLHASGGAGQALHLSAAATGDAPLSYLWLKDGHLVPDATGSDLILAALAAEDAGEYQCLVYNAKGIDYSDKVRLGVLPAGVTVDRVAITFPTPGITFHGLYLASGLQVQVAGTGAFDPKVMWRIVAGQGYLSIHPNSGDLVYNTPPWSGQVTLEARSLQDPTKVDQVTFGIDTITQVLVSPGTASLRGGQAVQLSASVVGGGFFDPTLQWSAPSGGGQVDAGGTFTPTAAPGPRVVRATSTQSPTRYGEATLQVLSPSGAGSDFDGDGRADILWRHGGTGAVYRMPMDGATVLRGAIIYTEPSQDWQIVACADFDGDGRADLLWWNSRTGQVYQMLMKGGTIQSQGLIYTEPNTAWRIQGTGDFDGDGRADILWRNRSTGAVFLMPMNGATVLPGSVIHTEPNPDWQIVAIADFDGDGRADLLWWNSRTGQVYQMLMNGSTIRSQGLIYTEPDTAWRIQGAGDFDGDGRVDLLWRNTSTGGVFLMPMSGATVLPGSVIHTEPNPDWQIVAIADFDGDGRADLLWWNSRTGQVYQMLMNGSTIRSQGLIYTEPDTAWRIQGGSH